MNSSIDISTQLESFQADSPIAKLDTAGVAKPSAPTHSDDPVDILYLIICTLLTVCQSIGLENRFSSAVIANAGVFWHLLALWGVFLNIGFPSS